MHTTYLVREAARSLLTPSPQLLNCLRPLSSPMDHLPPPSLRWRRLDLLKVFCLLVAPLFLLVSYWTPFHGRYPTREELRDTLRELDDAAYVQSGCAQVAKVLERCEKFRAECPAQYYFELRSINRNCHALRCAGQRARFSVALAPPPRPLTPLPLAHSPPQRPGTAAALRSWRRACSTRPAASACLRWLPAGAGRG